VAVEVEKLVSVESLTAKQEISLKKRLDSMKDELVKQPRCCLVEMSDCVGV